MNSRAFFDSLATTSNLGTAIGPVTPGEVHLFCYLACLMFLYRGHSISDWGYEFAATESGAPFSFELDRAIDSYSRVGFLEHLNGLMSLTDAGVQEYQDLSSMSTLNTRLAFLEPACSSALAVPVGLVRAAVHLDSNISSSINLKSSRHLFDTTSLIQFDEQFQALRTVLGDEQGDLLSPIVTWVSYFSRQALEVITTDDDD